MSESKDDVLELFPVMDSRFYSGQNKVAFGVKKGCDNVQVRQYSSNSASTSQISWNIKTPSMQSYVDRCILADITCQFKISAGVLTDNDGATPTPIITTVAQEVLTDFGYQTATSRDGVIFNNFPFNRMIDTLTITPNSSNLPFQSYDLTDMCLRLIDRDDLREYADTTVCEPAVLRDPYNGVFSNWNGGNYYQHFKPAGSFEVVNIQTTKADGAVPGYSLVTMNFKEPLLHPLCALKYGQESMSNISSFDINITLKDTNQAVLIQPRVFPGVAKPATRVYSGTVCSLYSVSAGGCKIHMTYLTPPLFMPLNTKSVVCYQEVKILQKKMVSGLGIGLSGTASSDTMSLTNMYNKLAIFVRSPPIDSFNLNKRIQNYYINKLTISQGRSNMLADFNEYELYQISKRNGWQGDFAQWRGKIGNLTPLDNTTTGGTLVKTVTVNQVLLNTVGAIVLIDPVYDLGMPSNLSSGSAGVFDLQLDVSYTNNTDDDSSSKQIEFLVVAFNDSVLVNSLGSSFTYKDLLNKEQVLAQDVNPAIPHDDERLLVGGSFFKKMWKVAKNNKGLIKKALNALPMDSKYKDVANAVIGEGKSAGSRYRF